MNSKELEEELENQLNCSICLDTFTNPKLLQCYHIFCQHCLEELASQDHFRGQRTIVCPSCRKVTPVSFRGAANLPSAFHISQLLEVLAKQKKVRKERAREQKKFSCPDHGGRIVDLYCESCGELMCWKCIKRGGRHHSHSYEELDDAFEKYKKEMTELTEKPLKTCNEALELLERSPTSKHPLRLK